MYLLIQGFKIKEGDQLTINNVDDIAFRVDYIGRKFMTVTWLAGESEGKQDLMPYSLFSKLGIEYGFEEEEDDFNEDNPNHAFLRKKVLGRD